MPFTYYIYMYIYIYIVTRIAKCLVLMIVFSLILNSLLHAISVDPMATTIMCFAIGLLSCILCMCHMPNPGLGVLLCVCDIFQYNIEIARAISSLTLTIAGYISKLTLTAIKKVRVRLINVVAAVLGSVILCTYITLAVGFVACAIMITCAKLGFMIASARLAVMIDYETYGSLFVARPCAGPLGL